MEYDREYISGDKWKRLREQRLQFDNYKCRNCGSTWNLEVHHKNYTVQGKEDIKDDLITLCSVCHYKITLMKRIRRKRGW